MRGAAAAETQTSRVRGGFRGAPYCILCLHTCSNASFDNDGQKIQKCVYTRIMGFCLLCFGGVSRRSVMPTTALRQSEGKVENRSNTTVSCGASTGAAVSKPQQLPQSHGHVQAAGSPSRGACKLPAPGSSSPAPVCGAVAASITQTIPIYLDANVISPQRSFWDNLHRNCLYMQNEECSDFSEWFLNYNPTTRGSALFTLFIKQGEKR